MDFTLGISSFLLNPIPIVIALAFITMITLAISPSNAMPPIVSRRQLVLGYFGVFVAVVVASAWLSYVSPEDAWARFKVPPENYWNALATEYRINLVLLSYLSLLGTAAIGAPIVMKLSRRGLATTPWVLVASVAISILFTGLLVLLGAPRPNPPLLSMAAEFVSLHLILSLGFCLGAGLQWRGKQRV